MSQKKVKAISSGYHLIFRTAGEVFSVPQELKGKWFVEVDKAEPITRPDAHPYSHKGKEKPLSLKPAKTDIPLA